MKTQFQKACEQFEVERCSDCGGEHCGACYREIKEKVDGMKDLQDDMKFKASKGE